MWFQIYFEGQEENYRVNQQVQDIGWVDFDFGCSIVGPLLPKLMRDGQNEQISCAR